MSRVTKTTITCDSCGKEITIGNGVQVNLIVGYKLLNGLNVHDERLVDVHNNCIKVTQEYGRKMFAKRLKLMYPYLKVN